MSSHSVRHSPEAARGRRFRTHSNSCGRMMILTSTVGVPTDTRLPVGTAPVFDAAADGLDREQPPRGIALLDAVHADAPNTEHPVLRESGTKPPRCGSACIAVARVQRPGVVDGHGADPRSDGSYRRTKVRKHATDTKVGQWAGDDLSRRTILEQARHLSLSESVLDAIAGSFPSSRCEQFCPAGRTESRRPSGMPGNPIAASPCSSGVGCRAADQRPQRVAGARPGCCQPVAPTCSTSGAVTPNRSPGASTSPMPCSMASW